MNIKIDCNTVTRLVGEKIPLEQLYKKVKPIAEQAGITLCEPQTGSGYLQWSLQGTGWETFDQMSDELKDMASQQYKQRRSIIYEKLKATGMAEQILTVPSDNFVFFHQQGTGVQIALAAWGYKYPNNNGGNELDTWISINKLQDVSIAFAWNQKNLPNIPFKLHGQSRITSSEGVFHVDQKLPVGKSYDIISPLGEHCTLTVVDGKPLYVFDLTQYFKIDINVYKDGMPLSDCECDVIFGDKTHTLCTDAHGTASLALPLVCNEIGDILLPQPSCTVQCNDKTELQTPQKANERLQYDFAFDTMIEETPDPPKPELKPKPELEPEPESKMVSITILDYEGYPVINMPVTLRTKKKGAFKAITNDKGIILIDSQWLTHKENVKVEFVVTQEYHSQYDIHYYKDKKSKQNKDGKETANH